MTNPVNKHKIENYKRRKINNWTVLAYSHTDKLGQQFWLVKCICDVTKSVRASHIIRGLSRGCARCSKSNSSNPKWKGSKYFKGGFLSKIRNSARKRNLNINVTLEYLDTVYERQNKLCALPGSPLPQDECSPDRIDNSKGYVIGNIQLTHKKLNIMRHALSIEEFIYFCNKVTEYHKEKDNAVFTASRTMENISRSLV